MQNVIFVLRTPGSVHSFCQRGNHYHLLLETEHANLSQGMQQLSGVYSQYFNRRHEVVGHVFQGRYHAILVQKESYLLELARYIVLNPVRANMVGHPGDWPWSSYRLITSAACPPSWLSAQWILEKFDTSQPEAIEAYRAFVQAGIDKTTPLAHAHGQLILGDEAIARAHATASYTIDTIAQHFKVSHKTAAETVSSFEL